MKYADIEPNRALSRVFLNEAPFSFSKRHKAQGARHKESIRSQNPLDSL